MRAIGLVEAYDHVCCRYRLRGFAPHLAPRGWRVDVRPMGCGLIDRPLQLREGHDADTIILQRRLLSWLERKYLKWNARRLVFDFDDAMQYRDSFSPSFTRKGPHCRRRARRFSGTVQLVDAVIAGNSYLADLAKEHTDADRVHVVPTCVNLLRYPRVAEHRERDTIELVWIGCSSTLRALEKDQLRFEQIGRYVTGSRLKVICDSFPPFKQLPVVPVRWSEAIEADELARADIGVSWLPDDVWSRGKCGLKILQYMAAGLPVVTNPVGVHSDMVEHGRSGFLVESISDWIEAISTLAADPDLRRTMGRRGRQIVAERYAVARWSGAFERILRGEHTEPATRPEFIKGASRLVPALVG